MLGDFQYLVSVRGSVHTYKHFRILYQIRKPYLYAYYYKQIISLLLMNLDIKMSGALRPENCYHS